MEDKEKQITEMAKTMCFQANSCTVKSCVQVNCEKTWLAENLYNAGYRKIPEDSVVLSREEYDNLKLEIQKAHNKGVQAGFDMTKFKEESIKRKTSKETVEKLIVKIKQFLSNVETVKGDNENKLQPKIGYKCSEVDDFFDELEKQFSVEIEE